MNVPLIRVSRKRSADPHEALVLHNKRVKHTAVFTLFKAAANESDDELTDARVLDLPSQDNRMEEEIAPEENDDPLGFVQEESVGLVGEVKQNEKKQEKMQVSLNGRLLQAVSSSSAAPVQDDVVFDYYAIHEKRGNAGVVGDDVANWEIDMEGVDVRFANRDELDLEDDEDSDGPPADDEDDSNDEDNWRNDYPDEDSYDEDSDHGDPYGTLEPGRWHAGEEYSDESFNRRLQNMDLNGEERYESYFEGEDTDDDGDY
uniref:Probable RNA polymerase II nuclear localization protein SLC7A6OS n=1 Tax=Caenorhabditis tropicalis TaxID=1561998 RepID=A0A1I7UUK3_9PELO